QKLSTAVPTEPFTDLLHLPPTPVHRLYPPPSKLR
ncbi:hypothetical protein SOVF_200960, partial [Spinacia oleracea]